MEVPIHRVYNHSRFRPNRNKYRALFTAAFIAVLSEQYSKFKMTHSHYLYVGTPISTCEVVINGVSDRANTRYGMACQRIHVRAVLTYVL